MGMLYPRTHTEARKKYRIASSIVFFLILCGRSLLEPPFLR
ncbi:mCG148412 [Mus musculus]|nr:mCG148412 [Mus musculus]